MAPSALIDLILANTDDKGLFGSAQPDEQVAQQQAQEQSASASSTGVKQSTSGQPDNSQDGGDKASSAEDGKAKDENSSTDSSQEQSEGSSSGQASQSDASSGGSGASGSAASNASENSGPASSSGSASAYQEPEPEPAPAPAPSTIFVYISIDSSRAQSYGLGGFSYGSTVYDALCATGASVSGSSYYVSAINGLAEKQCGNGSGWTYAVNGCSRGRPAGVTRFPVAKASRGSIPPRKIPRWQCGRSFPCKPTTPYSIAITPQLRSYTAGCFLRSRWRPCIRYISLRRLPVSSPITPFFEGQKPLSRACYGKRRSC